MLPERVKRKGKWLLVKIKATRLRFHLGCRRPGLLQELGADLLFCPFTAPFHCDPTVPTVCVIYDLQHRSYPEFFEHGDREERDRNFCQATQVADQLICISDYVRASVLENARVAPEQVHAIPIGISGIDPANLGRQEEVLSRLGLAANRFLLYPANFWAHKNHQMLLVAFGMYRARHPASDLKLVCTGVLGPRGERLRVAADRMGLDDRVVFPGYVPRDDLAVLLSACRALIFPSLYEGFGMPVVEAMKFAKPVLCSAVASLPEIAGSAALFFDPKKPAEIAHAIERLETDPALAALMVERGHQRVADLGDADQMARRYLQVLGKALHGTRAPRQKLTGVHADAWTSDRIVIACGASTNERTLEMVLSAPNWHPYRRLTVSVMPLDAGARQRYQVARGGSLDLVCPIPRDKGFVEILIDPSFMPREFGIGDDQRRLGCICTACRLVSAGVPTDLLVDREGACDPALAPATPAAAQPIAFSDEDGRRQSVIERGSRGKLAGDLLCP
jgi:glycosyltransferase involved in cell wall biosynthesis